MAAVIARRSDLNWHAHRSRPRGLSRGMPNSARRALNPAGVTGHNGHDRHPDGNAVSEIGDVFQSRMAPGSPAMARGANAQPVHHLGNASGSPELRSAGLRTAWGAKLGDDVEDFSTLAPLRSPTPLWAATPLRATPMMVPTLLQDPTPMREMTPMRSPTPMRAATPVQAQTPGLAMTPIRAMTPMRAMTPRLQSGVSDGAERHPGACCAGSARPSPRTAPSRLEVSAKGTTAAIAESDDVLRVQRPSTSMCVADAACDNRDQGLGLEDGGASQHLERKATAPHGKSRDAWSLGTLAHEDASGHDPQRNVADSDLAWPPAVPKLESLVASLGGDSSQLALGRDIQEIIKIKSRDNVSLLLGRAPRCVYPATLTNKLHAAIPSAVVPTTRATYDDKTADMVFESQQEAKAGIKSMFAKKRDLAKEYREAMLHQSHIIRR